MVYGCSVTVQRDSHSRNLKILEKNILEKKNLKIPEEDEEEPGGRGGVTRRDSEWRMLPPRRGGDPTQRKTDWSSHIPPLPNTNTNAGTKQHMKGIERTFVIAFNVYFAGQNTNFYIDTKNKCISNLDKLQYL